MAAPIHQTAKLFTSTATGPTVKLPGWTYAVVCGVARGDVKFDEFNGRWGKRQELDRFLQAYACERAKIGARKKGHTVSEQTLADGSIKLTIQVAGVFFFKQKTAYEIFT